MIQDDSGVFLIHPCKRRSKRRLKVTQTARVEGKRLLLVARDGILDGLSSVAEGVLGLGEDALALG